MTENFNPQKRISYKEQVSRSIAWGHYFIFVNIILACLIGFTYVYAAPPTSSLISFFYLIITWLGHMSFLTVVCYLVIFFPLAFMGHFRYYRVLCVLIAVILHTILLFDIKIYLLVKIHLGLPSLNLIVRELDFDTGLNYNFLLVAVPLIFAIECGFAKLTTHSLYRLHHVRLVRSILVVLGACFITSHVLHIWADATHYERITLLRSTFPAHYPMTARSFLRSHGWMNEQHQRLDVVSNSEFIKYPLATIEFDSEGGRNAPNILCISLNGLSFSDITAETSPHLYAFEQQVANYTEHYLPYRQELDNTFATSYGLPLQYQHALLNSQTPPVVINEMLRQDYVSRVVVSVLPETPKVVSRFRQSLNFVDGFGVQRFSEAHPALETPHDLQDGNAGVASAVSAVSMADRGGDGESATVNLDGVTAPAMAADVAGMLRGQGQTAYKFTKAERQVLNGYFSALVHNAGLRSMQLSYSHDVSGVFTQAKSLISSYQSFEQRPYMLYLVVNDLRDFARDSLVPDEVVANDPQAKVLWGHEYMLKQVDQAFGKFMQDLQAQGLLNNTMVVVTSNEGNHLLANGSMHFDREVQHVPLMILWPQKLATAKAAKAAKATEQTAMLAEQGAGAAAGAASVDNANSVDSVDGIDNAVATAANALPGGQARTSAGASAAAMPQGTAVATLLSVQRSSCDNLTSPWDISATIAQEVLHIKTPVGNYSLGKNLKSCGVRDFLIADGIEELILLEREDNIIYSHDGFSYVERYGERLQVRPNLENLIKAMRDLNRFLR